MKLKERAAKRNYAAPRKTKHGNYMRKLNKSLLPNPIEYYVTFFKYVRYIGNQQIRVCCCFHDDSNPSLSINTQSGAFFCFGCGAKGGDVIDFYKKINNASFCEAVDNFQAWEEV